MDSVTEPGILKDGILVPMAGGCKSARLRETTLVVGICPGTGQKQTSGSVIVGFPNYEQKGDNIDELDV